MEQCKDLLEEIYGILVKERDFWNKEVIDDPEERMAEFPSLFTELTNKMEKVLNVENSSIQIINAAYGYFSEENEKFVEVTKIVKDYHIYPRKLLINVNNDTFNIDPAFGHKKKLVLTYSYKNELKTVEQIEGLTLTIEEK